MARAFLLSHGARVGGAADTFVPAGKTISFYSEFDENTLRTYGLAALNTGDIQPTETFVGPCPVSNYYHSRFEDAAIAQHLASESSASAGRSYYVGSDLADPSWLCSTPTECARTYPQHDAGCQGVFARVAESEILSVACRGLAGGPGTSTMEMEGSREALDENQTEAKRILTWAGTDQAAAMGYWETLTQATQSMLASSYTPLGRYVEKFYADGGASTPAAVLDARAYIEAYGEETFFTWVQTLPQGEPQYKMIMADAALAASFEHGRAMTAERTRAEGVDSAWRDEAANTWVPSESDLAGVAETNRTTVKDAGDGDALDYEVAGFVLLIGANHAESWYTWARAEADHSVGRLTVEKGGTFSKGSFEVSGCPMTKQGVVESALTAFSDKKVEFV